MKKLFILMVAVLSSLSARSELPASPTISNDVTQNGLFVDYCSAPEIDTLSCWMSLLPSTTPLFSLTIPGLHDAATWSFEGATEMCIKDQSLNYSQAWNLGARVFDLRIAYEDDEFPSAVRFHHGDNGTLASLGIGPLNRVDSDIRDYFPTVEQLGDECMIFIVMKEWLYDKQMIEVIFKYFKECLVDKYGKERFIAYKEGMTLGEARGKILLFVRTMDFVFAVNDIPLNSIRDLKASSAESTYIDVFYDISPTMYVSYETRTQDRYEVACGNLYYDKLLPIQGLGMLENPNGKAYINGLNAYCMDYYLPVPAVTPSDWDICSYINPAVAQDLEQGTYPYHGIQLCDFYGVDTYADYNFSGLRLAKAMVRNNFKSQNLNQTK